ncbi:SCO family protein [Pseudomonas matsuisoli]|uniref:Copper-binding protein n=1 Tax=Pseudomonas matsuisoli TaxID=1515666 RepID=A0A917Q3H5_9PSED|nr:SCO family protein [Pseudomonas matsuisoli]GGK06900.1 copper-binding protein [Pseudomonas matsuisoli]
MNVNRLLMICLLATAPLLTNAEIAPAERKAALEEAKLLLLPRSRPMPLVALTDFNGAHFDTARLQGKWTLLFFGFTFCPDVCPTALSDMRRLFAELPAETRDRSQLIFVTADPQRDTPERLKTYLNYFDPTFIGLTGPMPELQSLSKATGLPFVPPDTRQEGYSVTHSGNMALIGPDGELHGLIRAPFELEALGRWLTRLVESDSAQ